MRRHALAIVALGLGLLLGAPAALAQELHGIGVLSEKNVAAGTVVIDGVTYHVRSSTVIRDLEGNRLELSEVPEAEDARMGPIMYEYFGISTQRGPTLTRLEMTRPPN